MNMPLLKDILADICRLLGTLFLTKQLKTDENLLSQPFLPFILALRSRCRYFCFSFSMNLNASYSWLPSLLEFPGHPLVSHLQSLPGHLNHHVTALSVLQRKKILSVIVDTMNVSVLFTVFFPTTNFDCKLCTIECGDYC